MKLTVLELNKATTPSIDEFSDFVQKIINENNDLLEFKAYESPHNNTVKVELLFGNERTHDSEIMAFGPAIPGDVLEQINGTLAVANNQTKKVKFVGLVPMSKSPRSVGFLVLKKETENKGSSTSDESQEAEKRTKDTSFNERTVSRRKSTKQS